MVMIPANKVPLFLFTYNCGKKSPLSSDFKKEISQLYDPTQENIPHLFVYGFQEFCSILDGISYDVVNSKLIQVSDLLVDSLISRYGEDYNFQTVGINHIGSIAMVIISPFHSRVSNVRLATGPCGLYMTSLKGGCGIRVSYGSKSDHVHSDDDDDNNRSVDFTFVVAHLNAHEGPQMLQRRNNDLIKLFQGLEFEDGHSILKNGSHCFLMGDLNYRATGVAGHAESEASTLLETTHDGYDEETSDNDDNIMSSVRKVDELTILRNKGEVFWGFDEADIDFKPTYKFKVGTLNYNYKRTPSWCDRILYQKYETKELKGNTTSDVKVLQYQSAKNFLFSDHIPVYLSIEVPFKFPLPLVSDSGYLIEKYGIVSGSVYLKPTKLMRYYKVVALVTDNTLGSALFFTTTNKGRIYLIIILFILYLVYKTIC